MHHPTRPSFHVDATALRERNRRLPPEQRIEFSVQGLADLCWVSLARMENGLLDAGLLVRRNVPSFTAMAGGLAAVICSTRPTAPQRLLHAAFFCRAAIDCTDVVAPTPALRMSVSADVFEAARRLIDVMQTMRRKLASAAASTSATPNSEPRAATGARVRPAGLAPGYLAQIDHVLAAHGTPPTTEHPRFPLPTDALQPPITARQARAGLRELRQLSTPLIHAAARHGFPDHAEAASLLLLHLDDGWPRMTAERAIARSAAGPR